MSYFALRCRCSLVVVCGMSFVVAVMFVGLFVICCLLYTWCYSLIVVCCCGLSFVAVCCLLCVVGVLCSCSLLVVCYLLFSFVACCSLIVVRCRLRVVCRMLLSGCCSLFDVVWFVVCCLSFVVSCSLSRRSFMVVV